MSSNVETKRERELNSQRLEYQNNPTEEEKSQADLDKINKAKGVLKSFGKAFSSMKIYPPENPSVRISIDTYIEKMKEFLEEYLELNIRVGEFSFLLKGETIFQDEEKKKSLPFLFFKDGMRELSFHMGADGKELQDFLELVKTDSELPAEESDIVNSLWVKNFPHIRFFALDQFLDSDIGEGEEETGFKVSKEELTNGEINLAHEDKIELYKRSVALGLHLNKGKGNEEEMISNPGSLALPSQMTAGSNAEIPEIESMVSEARLASRMTELINLLFEILFLEERLDRFSAVLNVLSQCYKEVLHKSDFTSALLILNQIQELREMLSNQYEEREILLERTLQQDKEETSMTLLRELFLDGQIKDYASFFQYLKFLGPPTLPLVGEIWGHLEDPALQLKASDLLQEIGQKDVASLVSIAQNNGTPLTKEIIAILGRIGNKEVISYLENFANHQDKEIRLEIVLALKKIEDETANKILIKFLSDKDEEVRITAATSLKYSGDKTSLDYVMRLAKTKDFKKRTKMEKKALLIFLAQSKSKEAYTLLQFLLKKWSIFSRAKQNETRLCVVSALKEIAIPEAVNILNQGIRLRNKAIRRACKLSLRKIAPKNSFHKITKGK